MNQHISRPGTWVSLIFCLFMIFSVPAFSQVLINEIRIDQPGTDNDEYFELAGNGSLDGLTYIVIGDGAGASGVIESVTDLTGQSISGGFFVAAEGTFTLGTADLTTSLDFENSDNVTHLLVRNFSGANGDDLDTNDDGILDVTPWTAIEDCLALIETPGSGEQVYCGTQLGPDGTFVPGHSQNCPSGWEVGAFDPVGGDDTPGSANTCSAPPPPSYVINEIRIDQPGTDNDEYFELAGTGSLDGFTYIVIGDGAGGSGVIESVTDLTGQADVGGFFVAAEGTFSIGTANLTTSLDFENSDNVTHLLVQDFTGASGDDLDSDDDGILDAMPWSAIADCLALVETPGSGDQVYCNTQLGPDGTFVPGHSINCPSGWEVGAFDPAGGDDTPGAANSCAPPPPGDAVINEIRIDQPSSDNDEYFELAGNGSLDGFSYIVIGDGAGGSGVIESVTNLTGQSISGGFFVAAEGTFTLGVADFTTSLNFENSDNVTHLLVTNFTGSNGDDLDTNDDGTLDITPWDSIADCVALIESPGSGDQVYCATQNGPSGSFVPGHSINCPAGWEIGAFDPAGGDDTPGAANPCAEPTPQIVINEIHADPASGDPGDANGDGTRDFADDEFVELVNTSGGDLDVSGWTLSDGAGVKHTFPAGSVIVNGCSAVIFGGGAPVGSFGNSLVQTASSGSLGLSNSGDSVIINDGVSDIASTAYGSEGGENQSLTLDPDVTGTDYVQHTVATGSGGALFSPGTRINGDQFDGCPVVAEIYEIQGAGAESPLVGVSVTTQDNTVTAVGPEGFFMQTPDARADISSDTSNGIFVATAAAPTVVVGDNVDVSGPIEENFGFTRFNATSLVTLLSSGNPLPSAVVFNETLPSADPLAPSCAIEYECYEGMLIEVPAAIVTGPNQRFGSDPIAEVHVTAGTARTYREPGIAFPGLPGLPVWDGNPEVFEVDPDKLGLPNEIISAGSTISTTGGLGFEFGGYEIWPTSLTVNPVPAANPVREREAGEMTVGALNLLRLFNDIDDGNSETVVATDEYLRRQAKLSEYIRDLMHSPDILAVSEVESVDVLQDLADTISLDDPAIVYTAYVEEGNDVGGIDVGFLVLDTVMVDSITQLGKDEILTFDGSLLNDRPPLLLEGRQVANGSDFPIAVIAIHGRSLSSIDSSTSGERVRQKRLEQAQYVAQQVQLLQDDNPDINLVVAGDFNAFEFTDSYVDVTGHMKGSFTPEDNLVCDTNPCTDFVWPDLINQVLMVPAEERYSFIFRGNAQVLDHALTSEGLDELVTDFQFARGNADAAAPLIEDPATPLRSSDHDGLVLYLQKDSDGDGVIDELDFCPGTVIPESAPTRELRSNRFALVDDDREFDTTEPAGNGPGAEFDIFDTAGCSCEQIVVEAGLGAGHLRFGCSLGEMRDWVEYVNQP